MRATFGTRVQGIGGQHEFRPAYALDQFLWCDRRALIHDQEIIGLLVLLQQYAVVAVVMHQGPVGLVLVIVVER